MDRVVLIRFGELFLKGKNKQFFENLLIRSIKTKLSDVPCRMYFGRGRYVVSDYPETEEHTVIERLQTVFGLQSISVAYAVSAEWNAISDTVVALTGGRTGSFRVNVHRAGKTFPMQSPEIAAELGARILDNNSRLSVDLHTPEFVVNVDIREDGKAYIYADKIDCAGGMPSGSAGKGLLLLSGGIDSPVAGYMMAKRGLTLDALHFHSYPYTSEQAKDKVLSLAKRLSVYAGSMQVTCLSFTEVQEAIHRYCDPNYMITVMRCFMMHLAERVAQSRQCGCIINGESLGQVASQTLESITVTNRYVAGLPIFRPCIGMDKQEIIDISRKIGTYDISIEPYEDCCTVFLPDRPVTRPAIDHVRREIEKIPDCENVLDRCFASADVVSVADRIL